MFSPTTARIYSIIRFLELRFARHNPDLVESNITPWRRAVVGDLTTAFDFRTPNASPRIALPSTDAFKPDDLERHPDQPPVPPAHGALPGQERGVRPARALPYILDAEAALHPADGSLRVDFRNSGDVAAVFQVRSGNAAESPRTYTVEPHKDVTEIWQVAGSEYDLAVYGPNGFHRSFKGSAAPGQADLEVRATYDDDGRDLSLQITNRAHESARVTVLDAYTSRRRRLSLDPGESGSRRWSLAPMWGWYDLLITVDGDPQFERRLAGHLENGEDSISDPAMGGLV